jgi:hypothetical protein
MRALFACLKFLRLNILIFLMPEGVLYVKEMLSFGIRAQKSPGTQSRAL